MTVKIKTQNDYLLTEVSLELPCDLREVDTLMRALRATGKVVASYGDGGLYGVNVEQKTKVRESVADKVREIMGVETKEINGNG
jgi:hypothetical protein